MLRERYRVIRRLGAGSGGSVYEVEDSLLSNARLALKALWPGPRDRDLVGALRAEFGVLATLRHPRLGRVHDFGRLPVGAELEGAPEDARGGLFLTRELVEGIDLEAAAVAADRNLGAICGLLADAAQGLELLHHAGMRHGDFKPANAIAGPAGVRLVDFGLTTEETTPRSAGTLAYMAPEMLVHRAVDRRADLYALGVALYQLATGEPPSGTRRGAELVDWHLQGTRPPLRALRPDAPESVDRLYAQLAARLPADRLPTASEAAAALAAAAVELGRAPASVPRELALAPLPMPQLAALERAFERRRRGAGGPALIEVIGDPGSGRSTLLTELGWRAALAGAEVVRAAPAPGRPLGALGVALDQIGALAGAPPPRGETGGANQRVLFARVGRWLAEAAGRWPIVVLLDDLDFADAATQALARQLAFALPDRAPVLLVGARATAADDVGESYTGAHERVGDLPRVQLSPLGLADVSTLLESAAGRADRVLAARVLRHTGGNLLHVIHTLAALDRRGFPGAASLDGLGLPARLEESLEESLAGAPAGERAVCEALAVLGRPATAMLVSAIANAPENVTSGLVMRDSSGRLSLARPGLSGSILGRLDSDAQATLHRRTADALTRIERLDAAHPEVVTHRLAAGDAGAARAHLAAAVGALADGGDLAGAAALGKRGLMVFPDAGWDVRLLVADLAARAGDLEVALSILEETHSGRKTEGGRIDRPPVSVPLLVG
ncbi:MAG TPA: serine/threonine-protein kinase, partial [Kofleriaceae bacterium]|nr:serine/threonine-protein kinase [Kofleriaceae bacterium]